MITSIEKMYELYSKWRKFSFEHMTKNWMTKYKYIHNVPCFKNYFQ